MTNIIKIIISLFLISYSIMFYIIYLNELFIDGILHYLFIIVSHIETLILFPGIYLLVRSLHHKT